MADEQDKWLDRETAELLLCGESPEAVGPAARDRSERLVRALGALSAPAVPADGELPGEAAALAAFRKVRAERADASAMASAQTSAQVSAALGSGAPPRSSDAGLVRIGARGDGARRPRRSRPLRLGLAAALTVGMVGGMAAAAGTGVLPTPFGGSEPEPAATVSAAASPDRPLAPPSPLDGARGGSAPHGAAPGDGTAGNRDPHDRRAGLEASCREVRAGKDLDEARERALKEAAGGSSRVGKYCGDLLAETDAVAQDRTTGKDGGESGDLGEAAREREHRKDRPGGGESGDKGKGDKGRKDNRRDEDDKGGRGDRDGKGGKEGKGGKGDKGGKSGDGGSDGTDDGDGDADADADGHPVAPPVRDLHGPHAPPAFAPLPRQGPAYAPHASSTVSATGVTLSAVVAQ